MNSYWIDSCPTLLKNTTALNEDIGADVCIIGGGITGLTCAYMLAKNGFKVVVLEKDLIGYKTTGNTTAKITSQHGLFYKYLIDSFSEDTAKKYLDANQNAISNIKQIIKEEDIDCDFEMQDAYVYATSDDELTKIKDEVKAVNSLGFNAQFVNTIPLPINNIVGAIKFPNQAQFHPCKYLQGLCNSIVNNSGRIYENTKVFDIKKDNGEYVTYTKNNKVYSKYVILASHYPIINAPGFYFLKMYQETSYIVAAETNENLFNGMYISSNSPSLSFRTANFKGKKLLLIGGSAHKVGAKLDLTNSYKTLEETAKQLYPDAKILYKWNTEDCISLDKLPYIGQFSELMPNMYVATGYKKWGMTTSNVAAHIITDKILGKENKYEDVFASTRLHPIKNKEELGAMLKEVTYSFALNKFNIPKDNLKDVNPNEGKLIEIDGNKIGVYKTEEGIIYAVKPVCSHLGCELSWNNIDKTWDCPCHGSRFDYKRKIYL